MNTFDHPVIVPKYGIGKVIAFRDGTPHREILVETYDTIRRGFVPENARLVKIEYQDGPTLQDEIVELKGVLATMRQNAEVTASVDNQLYRAQDEIVELKTDLAYSQRLVSGLEKSLGLLQDDLNTLRRKSIVGGFC